MKNRITAALAALSLGANVEKEQARLTEQFGTHKRRKKGGGRGGFRPPRHARARAWKRAFKGLAVPRVDNTQFMFE